MPEQVDDDDRWDALATELAAMRELVARAYEATPWFAGHLLRTRRSPEYASAYAASPLVTVRIGTYGAPPELFSRALPSVLAQTHRRWEAVVVCDGLEPETAQRIDELGDSRVRCLHRPRNGPYPASQAARWRVAGVHPFNDAIAAARGAWIAPLDHDDAWTADHLEVLLDRARETRAELVYGVCRAVVGELGETYFGAWPPAMGDFGFQGAIYHAGLAEFLYDVNAHLRSEPADWNLARRMLEAGVRFDFVDRLVADYFVEERDNAFGWWRERLIARGAYQSSPTDSGSGAATVE